MAEQKRNTRTSRTVTKARPVDEYGHLQPQAIEIEEAVLGALMIEKDAYSVVSEILRPESFYDRRHQLLYKAITTLAMRQEPVDILTVADQLRTMGELEEAGGPFYITQLSGKVASSAHIEYQIIHILCFIECFGLDVTCVSNQLTSQIFLSNNSSMILDMR